MSGSLTCSNCGAPITRNGGETHVICSHCKSANDFPPDHGSERRDHSSMDRHERGHMDEDEGIPNIVIIQAGPTVVNSGPSPVYVRRRSSGTGLFSILFSVILFLAIGAYIRHRVTHAMAEANSAERQIEKSVEKSEKAAEKKHH
jgi:hypothetical protein